MNVRLTDKILKGMNLNVERVLHIIDSKIILATILSVSVSYGEFVGTRIAEIQRKSNTTDWYWVDSKNNIAG